MRPWSAAKAIGLMFHVKPWSDLEPIPSLAWAPGVTIARTFHVKHCGETMVSGWVARFMFHVEPRSELESTPLLD